MVEKNSLSKSYQKTWNNLEDQQCWFNVWEIQHLGDSTFGRFNKCKLDKPPKSETYRIKKPMVNVKRWYKSIKWKYQSPEKLHMAEQIGGSKNKQTLEMQTM